MKTLLITVRQEKKITVRQEKKINSKTCLYLIKYDLFNVSILF